MRSGEPRTQGFASILTRGRFTVGVGPGRGRHPSAQRRPVTDRCVLGRRRPRKSAPEGSIRGSGASTGDTRGGILHLPGRTPEVLEKARTIPTTRLGRPR